VCRGRARGGSPCARPAPAPDWDSGAGARYVVRGLVFQFGEQAVVQRARFEFRHPALRIVDVSEDDGLAGADRLARGDPPRRP